ncbi:hypothetical protein FOCC_FOCC003591, partial [Frankliniella occidentalis]
MSRPGCWTALRLAGAGTAAGAASMEAARGRGCSLFRRETVFAVAILAAGEALFFLWRRRKRRADDGEGDGDGTVVVSLAREALLLLWRRRWQGDGAGDDGGNGNGDEDGDGDRHQRFQKKFAMVALAGKAIRHLWRVYQRRRQRPNADGAGVNGDEFAPDDVVVTEAVVDGDSHTDFAIVSFTGKALPLQNLLRRLGDVNGKLENTMSWRRRSRLRHHRGPTEEEQPMRRVGDGESRFVMGEADDVLIPEAASEASGVRQLMERLVESLVSGGLDDVVLLPKDPHPQYGRIYRRHQPRLRSALTSLAYSLQMAMAQKPLAECETPGRAHAQLRAIILDLARDVAALDRHPGEQDGVGTAGLDGVLDAKEDFATRAYEDILATAIVNK